MCFGQHGIQRSGNALARNISDQEYYAVFIDHKHIVKITADFLGRMHAGPDGADARALEGGKVILQQTGLDSCRDLQICFYACLFCHKLGCFVVEHIDEDAVDLSV